VTDGGRTGVALCEPLHGGSPEGMVTSARINKNGVKEVRSRELAEKRYRHRVSPRTTPARPPEIFPPPTEGLHESVVPQLRGRVFGSGGRHPAASPSWRRGKKSLLIRRDATLAFQHGVFLIRPATVTLNSINDS
jgi:hypothetical protein